MLILHGDNLVASRQLLVEKIKLFKTKNAEVVKLDGKKTNLTQIQQALESQSLFGSERIVIIEGLLSSPVGKGKSKLVDYLKYGDFPNLILWEGKKIDRLTSFKTAQIQVFKLPSTIFKFLDSFILFT